MLNAMNISVNGQPEVPPGFRFYPTEEELLHYYLRKKLAYEKIDLDVIRDVDLNKLEPWDIQEMCKIGASSTPQNDWYFFSHNDKKYPTGTRTNRATAAGFWKATGRDKVIYSNLMRIGMRKTLVFYRGRAPHGLKSDWIMHEYKLDDHHNTTIHDNPDHGSSIIGDSSGPEEGWVVCRVFKKKNYHKSLDNISTISISQNDCVLNQILTYMGRSSSSSSLNKQQNHELLNINKNIKLTAATEFLHLPRLIESPTNMNNPISSPVQTGPNRLVNKPAISDWATVDRRVACQLDGVVNEQYSGYGDDLCFSFGNNDADEIHELDNMNNSNERSNHDDQVSSSTDNDFWTFIRTSLS